MRVRRGGHRCQETVDLTEPQSRELHLALPLRGRRALAGEEAGPVGRAQDPVQRSRVQGVQRGKQLTGLAGHSGVATGSLPSRYSSTLASVTASGADTVG